MLPDPTDPPPASVTALAAGRPIEPVWRNEVGGRTFRIVDGGTSAGTSTSTGVGDVFVKWAPHGVGLDLAAESARLAWASAWIRVPEVLATGGDDDGRGSWMLTRAIPGWSAVDPRWHGDPRVAVVAVARGLRALHDALPVDACPFAWSPAQRIAASEADAASIAALGPAPEDDLLVVCHGDPCMPNTLLDDEGRWTAHVDLDALGVADRWADIAVATMSLGWNVGPGWDDVFLDAYGIAPDPERTAWYRALWNLGDAATAITRRETYRIPGVRPPVAD